MCPLPRFSQETLTQCQQQLLAAIRSCFTEQTRQLQQHLNKQLTRFKQLDHYLYQS